MAQGARQSSLFAAEDFSVVYESFSESNFQAYDYETIRNSMVDYINRNYPENFNDWISSSEFVSLIELMAFLGHNLAFRADLASRENYLSTAERRESALRIAEFLGYTPTRNVVASGYLKVDSVNTSEPVYDVDGNSLSNTTIQFEDATDPDTYQNFLTVMNSIFQSSSQFGQPFSKFIATDGTTNEIYRTKSSSSINTKNFSSKVNGGTASFSLHSVAYDSASGLLKEKDPNPYGAIDLLYKNDNSGFSSPNTGFFVGFKQGTLAYKDFNITEGLPNMVVDINESNVANGNVWVQTIDEVGQVQKTWTRVDKLFGLNSIFNASQKGVRDIYTVASRENDQISIVFADGQFGNIPRGIVRVWYRTGLNLTYSLNPDSFGTSRLQFDYQGADGNTYQAKLRLSLKSNVTNASARESIASIKANAGRFFATQDRMVTADDYSIFPVTVSDNIRKIKSVNRVHSGHSRFRDFYDPTATYSDAINYLDDGYLYEDNVTTRSLISSSNGLAAEQIYDRYIKPQLSNPEVKNFYYARHAYSGTINGATQYTDTSQGIHYYNANGTDTNTFRWNQVTKGANTSTGYITYNAFVQRMGKAATNSLHKAEVNGLVEFITAPYQLGYISNITMSSGGSGYTSTPTVTINGAGTGATGTAVMNAGQVIGITVTSQGTGYNEATSVTISGGGGSGALATAVVKSADTQWVRVSSLYKDGLGRDDSTGRPTGLDQSGRGAVVVSGVIPSGARIHRMVPSWTEELTESTRTDVITKIQNKNSFGLRYNASSQEWNLIQTADLPSNSVSSNDVNMWSRQYEGDATSTGRDQSWIIKFNYDGANWELLTRKGRYIFGSEETVKFNNLNFEETFSSDIGKPTRDSITVLDINTASTSSKVPLGRNYKFNTFGYYTYSDGYTDPHKIKVTLADPDNDGFPNNPEAFVNIVKQDTIRLGTKTDYGHEYIVYDQNGATQVNGRASLRTKYQRIADINQVIDPATTNIIDTYVLLNSYDSLYRSWALYDGRPQTKPNAPTVNELNTLFESLDSKKSISDQIIYRPVKYKILFGDLASSELQARFNVTKTANSSMSDSEIKSQVINLIQNYFSVENWDFGEEFYFTELAAFIHNNMIGQISQITIHPVSANLKSSDLFEISADSDELFLPVLTASNIDVNNTALANATSIASNTGVSI